MFFRHFSKDECMHGTTTNYKREDSIDRGSLGDKVQENNSEGVYWFR